MVLHTSSARALIKTVSAPLARIFLVEEVGQQLSDFHTQ